MDICNDAAPLSGRDLPLETGDTLASPSRRTAMGIGAAAAVSALMMPSAVMASGFNRVRK